HVDIPIVEHVAKCRATPGMKRQRCKARLLGNLVKCAVAIVAMKEERFLETRTGVKRIDLRIDMAVGNKNVEPSVVVHVEERRSPADVWIAWLADTGGPTDVVEAFLAPVVIERVGLLLKVRNEKAETPAVVVVAPIHAHVAKLHALAAERDAGEHAHVC